MYTIILATGALVIIILVCEILLWKRDWFTAHVLCPREIQRLGTSEERGRVASRAFLAFLRRPTTWVLALCYVGAVSLVNYGLREPTVAFMRGLPGSDAAKQVIGGMFLLILQVCPCILLVWHSRSWMRRFLRDYLNEHGIPICRKCGYDLRGHVSEACPECGMPVENIAGSE